MKRSGDLVSNVSALRETSKAAATGNLCGLFRDNREYVQRLTNYKSLPIHNGCVNSVIWNASGNHLLSGSDDQRLVISDPFCRTHEVVWDYKTVHRSNIFCARFLPNSNDEKIISCSGDGVILVHDLQHQDSYINRYECHDSTCYKLLPLDSNTFLSCSEDKTVRFYDIRCKQSCCCRVGTGPSVRRSSDNHQTKQMIKAPRPVSSMAMHPAKPYEIALGVADSSVYIHDRRMLDSVPSVPTTTYLDRYCVPTLFDKQYRVTSVNYSADGSEILASMSLDYIYLFQVHASKGEDKKKSYPIMQPASRTSSPKAASTNASKKSKKLRLRGDWSDTGPNARPSAEGGGPEIGQARPTLQNSLMERMTLVLSQMLNTVNNSNTAASALEQMGIENEQLNDLIDHSLQSNPNRASEPPVPEPASSASSVIASEENSMDLDAWNPKPFTCYTGHRNARTMIKETNFWGSKYIMSGSDCGHIFFWDKNTAEIVCILEGDKHVVNNVQPHPYYPILATSGIDYDVKLWQPSLSEPQYDNSKIQELLRRNALMLEESKDTVTVPATFLIRMMSCLSHLRQQNAAGTDNPSASSGSPSQQSPSTSEEGRP